MPTTRPLLVNVVYDNKITDTLNLKLSDWTTTINQNRCKSFFFRQIFFNNEVNWVVGLVGYLRILQDIESRMLHLSNIGYTLSSQGHECSVVSTLALQDHVRLQERGKTEVWGGGGWGVKGGTIVWNIYTQTQVPNSRRPLNLARNNCNCNWRCWEVLRGAADNKISLDSRILVSEDSQPLRLNDTIPSSNKHYKKMIHLNVEEETRDMRQSFQTTKRIRTSL